MTGVAVQIWHDKASEIIAALHEARDWLVKQDDLDNVIEFHARGKAIEVYVAQKEMGHDMELAAAEIVRRAERRIAALVKEGRARGEIVDKGAHVRGRRDGNGVAITAAQATGMHRGTVKLLYPMDGCNDATFEEAITRGRFDGDLGRAAVTRQIRAVETGSVAVKPTRARKPPRNRSPEDYHYGRRHLPDSDTLVERFVEQVVAVLDEDHLYPYIDFTSLDPARVDAWVWTLLDASRKLARFRKELIRGCQRHQS